MKPSVAIITVKNERVHKLRFESRGIGRHASESAHAIQHFLLGRFLLSSFRRLRILDLIVFELLVRSEDDGRFGGDARVHLQMDGDETQQRQTDEAEAVAQLAFFAYNAQQTEGNKKG